MTDMHEPSSRLTPFRLPPLLSNRWLVLAAALTLGVATSFSQAPYSFWPLAILGPAGAMALGLASRTSRKAAKIGWAFGVGYFLPGLLWIGAAFLVEAEKFAWMQPFAVTLLPMGLALFWAPVFWAARRTGRGPAAAFVGAGLWALVELARGYVLTGFPWGLFAFSWIETPVAQTVAWIGPYGLNALTILSACLLAGALFASRSWQRAAGVALAAMIPITLFTAGAARHPSEPTAEGSALIRLVQPNVPQTEKWIEQFRQRNFDRLMALSRAPSEAPLTYIVWPETATPFMIDRTDALRVDIMGSLPDGVRLILGSQRYEPAAGADAGNLNLAKFYNSLFVIGAGGGVEAVYDKHHLVPFGEYLPFQDWLQSMGVHQLAGRSTGFNTGPGPVTLAPRGAPSFSPLICYEAIFPQEMPSIENRPDMLLQVTNDAWFGDSSGPWQHLVQARFRAIEQGLPLIRSANTGITASIDPYGNVMDSLGIGVMGAIDVRPAAALNAPPYARMGDWPAALAMILLAFIGFMLARLETGAARRV